MRGLYRGAVLRMFQRMRQAVQGGRVLRHDQHQRQRQALKPSQNAMAPQTWCREWLSH